MLSRLLLVGLSVLVLAALPGRSPGAASGPVADLWETAPLVAFGERAVRSDIRQADDGWNAFLTRNPGWVARWDAATGTPRRARGPALAAGEFPTTVPALDRGVRQFLDREGRAWVDADRLQLETTARDPGGWWIHYSDTRDGRRVVGSKVSLRVTEQGVPSLGVDAYPELQVEAAFSLTGADAAGRAVKGIPPSADPDLVSVEEVVVPLDARSGRPAYEVRFTTLDPPGAWVAWIDAAEGTLLARRNEVRHGAVTGTVRGTTQELNPFEAPVDAGIPYVRVEAKSGDTVLATAEGGSGGSFTFDSLDGMVTLSAFLAGPFGSVENAGNGNATPLLEVEIDASTVGNQDLTFGGGSTVSDRTAFAWAMASRDYIRGVDPGFDRLDYEMPIVTDISTGSCNAFWNGQGVNFFAEGGGCPNIGRVPSVVIHEYGHGITDFQYRPFGAPSGAMHEGFSDYTSASLLNDPRVGHGFFGPGSELRNVKNDLRVPNDVTGSAHSDGLIIAGALWDLRVRLGAEKADQLWHFARYGLATNFDDYFLDVLLTDDDDGNIYNGTPNISRIVASFERHGIGDYSIQVSHAPLADREDAARDVSLTATFLSISPLSEETVTAHVRTNGGKDDPWESGLVMTPGEGIREFSVDLGVLSAGTEVFYWFTAEDEAGHTVLYPDEGDVKPFYFRVGVDTTPPRVEHQPLGDQPADNTGLALEFDVWDNGEAGAGEAVVTYSVNGGAEAQVVAPAGEGVRRSVALPAGAVTFGDEVSYWITASDNSAAGNETRLPAEGAYSFRVVNGFVRDFEASAGGMTGAGDWEWGAATFFTEAFSGDNLWGTRLDQNYRDNRSQNLSLGPVSLAEWSLATLSLRHRYQIESDWDGGVVEAWVPEGVWTTLVPEGGYPSSSVVALGGNPGYSGTSDGWELAEFDLSPYVGEPVVHFRLRFNTDESVNAPGWYIDDLSVVERRLFASPREVKARSGIDGSVPITWTAPAGFAPGEGSPLVGYHVYRAAPAWFSTTQGDAAVRLTTVPVLETQYQDLTPVNGVFWEYSVSAVYVDGESPRSEAAEAIPFLAVAGFEVDSLFTAVRQFTNDTVEIPFRNEGTGYLQVNLWPAEAGQTLDDVRLVWEVPAPSTPEPDPAPVVRFPAMIDNDGEPRDRTAFLRNAERSLLALKEAGKGIGAPAAIPPPIDLVYTQVAEDPKDGVSVLPDISTVEIGATDESIYVRLTTYQNWPNPFNDFSFLVSFDLDGDRGTGVDGDLAIFAGRLPQTTLGAPVVLLDGEGGVIGVPHYNDLQGAARQVTFGFFRKHLGDAETVQVWAASLNKFGTGSLDDVPDRPVYRWFSVERPSLRLFTGREGAIRLDLNGNQVLGFYEALLLMETNDPERPEIALPVRHEVGDETAVSLLSFAAASAEAGVLLDWSTAREENHLGFHVFRAEGESVEELRLTREPLRGSDGVYRFLDRDVIDGRTYRYRVADLDRSGTLTYHGPRVVRYSAADALTASVLHQNVPNPVRSSAGTSIRFGLPRAEPVYLRVYSVDGRLVRTLAGGDTYSRGFHEIAWDGRDETGRSVGAGVYTYLLRTGQDFLTRKLVIVP